MNRMQVECSIGLFAKFPVPGLVKTRMIPELGPQGACDLAAYLLLSILDRLLSNPESSRLSVVVWTAGGTPAQWEDLVKVLPNSVGQRIVWKEQPDQQLGERMAQALEFQLTQSAKAIVVGTDAIEFDLQSVEAIAQGLNTAETLFVPALDGGYVAVGTHRVDRRLFAESIPWGTSSVMQKTLELAKESRLTVECLPPQLDLDEPDDLGRAIKQGLLPIHWAKVYKG